MDVDTNEAITKVLMQLEESIGELLDRVGGIKTNSDQAKHAHQGMIKGIEACRGMVTTSVEFWGSK